MISTEQRNTPRNRSILILPCCFMVAFRECFPLNDDKKVFKLLICFDSTSSLNIWQSYLTEHLSSSYCTWFKIMDLLKNQSSTQGDRVLLNFLLRKQIDRPLWTKTLASVYLVENHLVKFWSMGILHINESIRLHHSFTIFHLASITDWLRCR